MRASVLAVATLACAASVLAACGGSPAEPFTIGVLSDCYGPAGGLNELNVASAELPLITRGAELLGRDPVDGIGVIEVAGRRIRLIRGCVAGTEDVIPEARRLVEEEGAQAIVGIQDPAQGMVLRLYARRRPRTAFVIEPSAAPELTLIAPARNVFRFTLDAAQSNGGLGGYAYRHLRWRTAAVVADDVPYAWEQAWGFVAEFCALGGRVVKPLWVPFGVNPAAAAAMVPRTVDGIYVAQAIVPMAPFLARYAALGHDLSRQLVASAEVVADPGVVPTALGVVVGGNPGVPETPGERAYVRSFARAFPNLSAAHSLSGTALGYDVGVEAVLEALERAHGTSGKPFLNALAATRPGTPLGRIRLDRNRQAIGRNYLSRVTARGITSLRVVPGVEQSFGGYFTSAGPPPSETLPGCAKRTPPPWAR